jgi:predicted DNA-binding transcriptional regulator AlpA
MTITVAVRAGAGIVTGSDLNVGHLAREDAESHAQGRAAGMATFLRFVDEAVDLSTEKQPELPIKAKSEPVKVVSPAIPGRKDATVSIRVAKRGEKLADGLSYPPRLLRSDRAAAYLSMSESHFLKLVKDLRLPKGKKLGGIILWDRARLDNFADNYEGEEDENTVADEWSEMLKGEK